MKDEYKVSIIMPVFNSENTIQQSICSVLNQGYKNWELIIIDDSSIDRTEMILHSFNDPRIIKVKNIHDKGVAGARRTGIELATGAYIAFLDSDDLWSNNKLEHQIKFMNANNYSFTYTDYYIFSDDISNIQKTFHSPDRIDYSQMLRKCNLGCLTVILESSLCKSEKYDDYPKEDYVFWLKILKKVDYAYRLSEVYAYYRVQNKSLSSNKFNEIFKQWFVYRCIEKINFFKSIYLMINYIINGIIKHYG